MKEDFLHYLWRYGLYASSTLKTTQGEVIQIISPGFYNKNTGPDFLHSELNIDGQKWVGNVEIHVNSSDWYVHQHEIDPNYDAVTLHVVWNHDSIVFMKDGSPLPTLELKGVVSEKVLLKYQKLNHSKQNWIPCEQELSNVDPFIIHHWLERLYFERLESRTLEIERLLEASQNDWESVLFQMLSKNFGLNINGDTFLKLAQSFDFQILRKERNDIHSLSALLFGQAGFFEAEIEDEYFKMLKKEYRYLRHKYALAGLKKKEFQFFRMRPHNFPTVRIAQLIGLYHKNEHLFSAMIEANTIEDYYLLCKIEVHDYWKTHFNFGKESRRSAKKLTKSFMDLIIINTMVPLKFYYLKAKGKLSEDKIIRLMESIKPEYNTIVDRFSKLQIKASNALQSQGLIELKNNYCTFKRCLECAIGKTILDR
jgi:hypothetical protein